MSSSGGSSGRRFWGIQLTASDREKNVRVKLGTELHISKAIVEFSTSSNKSHQDNCCIGIGVRYEEDGCDCCDCPDVKRHLGEHCALHPQENRQCIVGVIKPEKKQRS